jgi:hypothetical protein
VYGGDLQRAGLPGSGPESWILLERPMGPAEIPLSVSLLLRRISGIRGGRRRGDRGSGRKLRLAVGNCWRLAWWGAGGLWVHGSVPLGARLRMLIEGVQKHTAATVGSGRRENRVLGADPLPPSYARPWRSVARLREFLLVNPRSTAMIGATEGYLGDRPPAFRHTGRQCRCGR